MINSELANYSLKREQMQRAEEREVTCGLPGGRPVKRGELVRPRGPGRVTAGVAPRRRAAGGGRGSGAGLRGRAPRRRRGRTGLRGRALGGGVGRAGVGRGALERGGWRRGGGARPGGSGCCGDARCLGDDEALEARVPGDVALPVGVPLGTHTCRQEAH